MIRFLLPLIVGFAFGFFAGMVLFSGRRAGSSDWEVRYRDLYQRYRELTRDLRQPDDGLPPEYARLRQGLWDLRDRFGSAEGLSAEQSRAALAELDAILESTRGSGDGSAG